MTNQHVCPRCRQGLAEERMKDVLTVCGSCGFVVSASELMVDEKVEQSNFRWVVGLSIAMALVITQLASWGSHAPEIRWIQLRDLTGTATISNLERMVTICKELKKWSCVEYAYAREAKLEPKNTVRLAEFLFERKKFKEAAASLKKYVQTAKHDQAAYFAYAKALGEIGQADEATRYYEYLLNARQRKVPTVVAENYVRHLARAKRYDQAQNVILKLRRAYHSPRLMDSELRILTELRNPESVTRGIASSPPAAPYQKR